MSDLDDQIKMEMRLRALEYFVSKVNVSVILALPLSDAEIDRGLEKLASDAEQQVFAGLDAAWSDHVSAEWSAAVRRLIEMQKDLLALARQATR
jgi:hypothetical protein